MSRFVTPTIAAPRRTRAGVAWLPALARCACLAALAAVYADAAADQSIGRLFFSLEERRTLDDMRANDTEPQPQARAPGPAAPVAPVVDVISFDGKVERSGGGSATVWVNGRAVYTGDQTVEGIRIHSGRGTAAETRFVLPPSDIGETDFSLKVGQKIAVQSGKVLDSYEARAAEDAESAFAKDKDKEKDKGKDEPPAANAEPGNPQAPAAPPASN